MVQYISCAAALLGVVGVANGQFQVCDGTEPTDLSTYCDQVYTGSGGEECYFTIDTNGCDAADNADEACAITMTAGYANGTLICNGTHEESGVGTPSYYGVAAVPNPCLSVTANGVDDGGYDYSSCFDADVTGGTCTPTCKTGYLAGGSASTITLVCAADGIHTAAQGNGLTCTAYECDSMDSSAQAGFAYTTCTDESTDVTGTTCTPTCKSGYDSGGTTSAGFEMVCSSGNEVTTVTEPGTGLVCTPIVCASVTNPEAGFDYSSCLDGETTGSTCMPACLSGFTNGDAATGSNPTSAVNAITMLCTDADATDGIVDAGNMVMDDSNIEYANSGASTGLVCSVNGCTAGSGDATGYTCSTADGDTVDCVYGGSGTNCAAGSNCQPPAAVGDGATTGFGAVTCNAGGGYGTGPLALAAGNGPTVTCLAPGGAFAFTGCHFNKCNAITGPSSPTAFSEADCTPNPGTKIKPDIDIFCESSAANGCASSDCCTNIDECTELDDPAIANTRTDIGGDAAAMHGCASNTYCTDADPTDSADNGVQGTTIQLNGDTAGTTSSTHTCTCDDGYFGNGDAAGTGCTACTAVANSENITCTTAQNSRANCVEGAILVPAVSLSTADVCRLECPFVDLMSMIDTLNPTCPTLSAGADIETSKDSCEATPGCYYIKAGVGDHSCGRLYDTCKTLSANNETCTGLASPQIWGTSTVANAAYQQRPGCHFVAAHSTFSDRCEIQPSLINSAAADTMAGYSTVRTAVVRCTALLNTGWAHDLRGSCDASQACPLHDAGVVTGLVGEVAKVFPQDGFPDLGLETDSNGVSSGTTNDGYFTSLAGDSSTTFEICSEIRDAVNAAPTCSSGS